MVIATINVWNRLAVSTRTQPPAPTQHPAQNQQPAV